MRITCKVTIKAVAIFLAILFLIKHSFHNWSFEHFAGKLHENNEERKNQSTCILPKLNPYDAQVLPFLSPSWNPLKKCKVSTKMHTELKDGVLKQLINSTSTCFYRCLYRNAEDRYAAGEWFLMQSNKSYREECDFIEIHCCTFVRTTFRYIHSQVHKPKLKHFQAEDISHPSVLIFLLDSVSSSTATRSASKTIKVLRENFEAVQFHYHNKVGLNSRPNAFAIFAGVRTAFLDADRFLEKSVPELIDSCRKGLNREETITFDFINNNYATLITEDWVGAFSWPDCVGYGFAPTDHYTSPLIIRSTSGRHKTVFDNYFYYGRCKETFHRVVNYAGKFLKVYENIAKFAVVWLSHPAHNTINGVYRIDEFLANFFHDNMKLLEGSFVFFMSDHGLRLGAVRSTQVGYLEDNNPLLIVAVPKYLRRNAQLMHNLQLNSQTHTSHYDIFGTLYDIIHTAQETQFQEWNMKDFRNELGETRGSFRTRSLLRPIMLNRTCDEMEIPDEFCLCKRGFQAVSKHSEVVKMAARHLLEFINNRIKRFGLQTSCSILSLSNVSVLAGDNKIFVAEKSEGGGRLRLVIITTPGNAKIEAEMRKNYSQYNIISTSVSNFKLVIVKFV
ncbi:unnamed protein product [Thelazia callipaeda]|uniref:Sulfatase domain-containing protein n=1 Tax=Thelazia callipaeda TaxID=103827 RepID=A0A0N5CZ67_THECL|nr:unnamed protein product [Thelazia callipaeda]